jgi:hypothetical protein
MAVTLTCSTYCEHKVVETRGQMAADLDARVDLIRSLASP